MNCGDTGKGYRVKTTSCVAALLVGLTFSSWASADSHADDVAEIDIEAGSEVYKKSCRRCHGPTAKGLASFPKLVGQTAEYLVDKLERYRAGESLGPNTRLMAPNAKELSDADIANIANFITSLE